MNKTQNLRHLLTELIRSHGLESKILEQKVFALWQKRLGTPLGTKTVPVSLSGGILKIYADHPAYITEISFHKQHILADLNAELGEPVLVDIRVELRRTGPATPRATARSATHRNSGEQGSTEAAQQTPPEQKEKIEQALTDVSDTELKKSLSQLFTTQSARKP